MMQFLIKLRIAAIFLLNTFYIQAQIFTTTINPAMIDRWENNPREIIPTRFNPMPTNPRTTPLKINNDFVSSNLNIFYPFGPEFGDQLVPKADDSFVGPIEISTSFQYFDKSYTSLFVDTNGLVSFDTGVSTYVPIQFPLQSIISVAPFWADVDIRYGGEIFYREITDFSTLNRLSYDIQKSFSDFNNFRVTWAFVATWDQVAVYGSHNSAINNTFQLVIATNGRYSFTIYNYDNLMWSYGTASSGVHAQAGFNAGDGKYFVLEGSFTSNVKNLNRISNVNIPGKWIFRIDSQVITEGGCNSGGFLTITPLRVNVIGGDHIYVSGPCFQFANTYSMMFDNDQVTDCVVIDTTKSICKVPFLKRIGKIPLKMSTNGNFTFDAFIISKDVSLNPDIKGLKNAYEVNQLTDVVKIYLNSIEGNVESESITYSVIFTYIERSTGTKNSLILKDNQKVSTIYIDLSIIQQQIISLQDKIVFGFICVVQKTKILNFYNFAVDYTVNIAVNSIYIYSTINNFYYGTQCKQWYYNELSFNNLNKLPGCWRQISLDFNGNFPVAFGDFTLDRFCSPNNPDSCNLFHPGAAVCYQSISSFNGVGQQCCYTENARLLVGEPGGGVLNLAHSNDVWNHFIKDIEPYFTCCMLSDKCKLYYEKRPSDDGARWEPPRPARISGDPHLSTLDGLAYTFNGYGEFILLEVDEILFSVQVRMSPFINSQRNQATQGTVISCIAIQHQSGTLQLQITRLGEVEILVNSRFLEIGNENNFNLDGLNLYISPESYTLQFTTEINVDISITAEHNAFSFIIALPDRFKNKTKGLLGIMDDDISNDFSLPNGTVLALNASNDREIFYNFGEYWRNTPINSIFTYSDGFTHSDYVNRTFIPRFMTDGIIFSNSTLETLARQHCQGNLNCLFDVSLTEQISIGLSNIILEKSVNQIQEAVRINEITCVPLNSNFQNGIINTTVISHGYEYKFFCNPTYCLNGEQVIRCENSTYNSEVPACLPCPDTQTVTPTVFVMFSDTTSSSKIHTDTTTVVSNEVVTNTVDTTTRGNRRSCMHH